MNDVRKDRVVIMARGLGSRMGTPKGLLRFSAAEPVFVRMIADLYLEAGLGVDVVTRQVLARAYRNELPDTDAVRVVPGPDGGDTALTLLTAWRFWADDAIACTHVWAHPVDLPLVTPDSLALLRDFSRRDPQRVIRPFWQGKPGHPVVMPTNVLEILDRQEAWPDQPLRSFLEHAVAQELLAPPQVVAVPDPGIVRDFDRPEDLVLDQLADEKRGTP